MSAHENIRYTLDFINSLAGIQPAADADFPSFVTSLRHDTRYAAGVIFTTETTPHKSENLRIAAGVSAAALLWAQLRALQARQHTARILIRLPPASGWHMEVLTMELPTLLLIEEHDRVQRQPGDAQWAMYQTHAFKVCGGRLHLRSRPARLPGSKTRTHLSSFGSIP